MLTGPGIVGGAFFNPALAGKGTHTLSYTFGNAFCETSTTLNITITTELTTEFSVSDTVLCPGESSTIEVTSAGGVSSTLYTYTWNNGLFPVSEHTVSPSTSTWYVVATADGCSDPVVDSVFIEVTDGVVAKVKTSQDLCFGAKGYAQVILDTIDNYNITWETTPVQTTDSIEGVAGSSYSLEIVDKETGCTFDTLVKIPSFDNIVANFSTSPNYECIPSDQKVVTFLDLSHNADSGTWDIAGLLIIKYELGKNPKYQFTEAGYYTVTLTVYNDGDCSDVFTKEICVEDIRPIFVADAFTPNGDGVNDVLHVKAKGVKEIRLMLSENGASPEGRVGS